MANVGVEEQEAKLERMLTRLALTEDDKLENVLAKLLPFAISCLAERQQSIRQKVMEMLSHINKRVKDQPSIKLPLLDLLALYQNENSDVVVRSFALIYLEMSYDRHPKDDLDLAPELLRGLSKVSVQQQDILLRICGKDLEKYALKCIGESYLARCKFLRMLEDRDIFLEFCLQTILYQSSTNISGLSKLQACRVSGKEVLKGESLMRRKVGMLNVISELKLTAETLYPLLLVASVDSNETVSKRAEELLKKKATGVNLEDPTLIRKLFSMFQGTIGNSTAEDARISPASPLVKEKIMNVFTRSIAAANSFPATLHCLFDCLFGTESFPRLKQSGMEFSVWVFKHARDEQMKPMAPIILNGVLKLLSNPPPGEGDTPAKQLRMFAYQTIGQLGKRAPYLFRNDLSYVKRLFKAFKDEPSFLSFTMQEALISLASAYKDCSETVAKEIIGLLLGSIGVDEGSARFCSVWWAKNLFPFTHCASRFICMLGAADQRLDVRDMALEGLLPPKKEEGMRAEYPLMSQMLDFICEQQPILLGPSERGERELLFQPKAYASMIQFLLNCYSACETTDSLEQRFIFLLEHAMASDGTVDLHALASKGLLMVASTNSQGFAKFYSGRVYWLKQYVGHIDRSTRQSVGKLLGIVISEVSTSVAVDLLRELRASFPNSKKGRFEDIHGAICAAGYILAQCSTGTPSVPWNVFELTLSNLLELGDSVNMDLSGAVVESIGLIGIRCPLLNTLDNKSNKDQNNEEVDEENSFESKKTSESVLSSSVKKLFSSVISSKDAKAVQKAVIAYGHMCFSNFDERWAEEAVDAILGLCRSKVEEILFSVGESLCFIWGSLFVTADEILKTTFVSLSSTSDFLNADVEALHYGMKQHTQSKCDNRGKIKDRIVRKLFDDLLYSSRKEERCAGAVWLVFILMHCGKDPHVHKLLPDIQEAFCYLLGEQNELTQEMASRGLSIVYELGDAASKDDLVKALVNSLSGKAKRKRSILLTEDSEVLEENVLGEKSGGKLTTYKELCSLANEIGQPDLIYKFMDLAHQSSLNSKKIGAAFGFARIARQAHEALSPYLPTLIPKLVRYQYDPNKLVQDAMVHIWRSLVPEPKRTIDQYLDVIMEDLILQAGSRLWRARESSCLALADILQGRRFQEVGKYLAQIWVVCFRAIDDVKETVRTSGLSLSRSISSLTVRLSDTQLTNQSEAESALSLVIPVLLSKGIPSNIADIQRVSMNTLVKIAKNAGTSLQLQIVDVIVCMLESLSSLEDQRLNYAELHIEKTGVSSESFENLRVSMAMDSPMWETLHFCLQKLDEPVMEKLVPRLIQLVRSGVGLNTRVGVSRFIDLMMHQHGPQMKKFTGVLLKVLKTAAQEEKSPAARQALVSACVSVAKYADNTQVQSLVEDVITLFNENIPNTKITSALLLKGLSNQAHNIFVGYHALVLPSAFIARFDDDKTVSNMFEELWEESISGESIALQLYAAEIVQLAIKGLSNTSWTHKKRCARALTRLAETAGPSIAPYVEPLLSALLEELPGHLWEGKEVLLDAVSAICRCYSTTISECSEVKKVDWQTIGSAVLTACSKRKTNYRNAALSCLEQVFLHCDNETVHCEAFSFLLQHCSTTVPSKGEIHDGNQVDGNIASSLEKTLLSFKANLQHVSICIIRNRFEELTSCLAEKLTGSYTWQIKLATVATIQELVGRISKDGYDEGHMHIVKSMEQLLLGLLECIRSVKVGQVRITCLQCMSALLEAGKWEIGKAVKECLLLLSELERDPSVKAVMETLLTTLSSNTTDLATT